MDPEFRAELVALFGEELRTQTEAITTGLLAIEQQAHPEQSVLDEVFRASHNLKGSSRALGFGEMADLAHGLESCLSDIRSGAVRLTPELLDLLLSAVDAIGALFDQRDAVPEELRLRSADTGQLLNRRSAPPSLVGALEISVPRGGFRPSADVLFESAAGELPGEALGLILTGMGQDGAVGLKAMHDAGCPTLAQSGDTCVIDGMPAAAREVGGVDRSIPLDALGATLSRLLAPLARQ